MFSPLVGMDILFLKGWRYEIFGTNLKKILAGDLKFFIEDGKLVCK